jgi:GMP synthase (glutamine-hydrolysing)
MKAPSAAGIGRRTVLLALGLCCVVLVLIVVLYSMEERLHGLLVDLELEGPDTSRYQALRDAFTQQLPRELGRFPRYTVTVDYVHFTGLTTKALDPQQVDFLILSPQGTPWHRYQGEAGRKLEVVKQLIRTGIVRDNLPVLGICGGHQFLALTFGGTVDFIDPAWAGKRPERYPKEAVAERGVVVLETVLDDPIFAGVVSHPGTFRAAQSHYEEVKKVPEPFVNIARSAMSTAQLMRIPGKPVYGLAFHPERCWNADECSEGGVLEGRQILANFLTLVSRRNQ